MLFPPGIPAEPNGHTAYQEAERYKGKETTNNFIPERLVLKDKEATAKIIPYPANSVKEK